MTMTVGVSIGADSGIYGTGDQGRAQYNIMKADGFWGIRSESAYGSTGGGNYQASIQAALDAGLHVLMILDVNGTSIPDIAPDSGVLAEYPSFVYSGFIAFVQEQVTYWSSRGIHHWEILNEPNIAGNWDTAHGFVNPAQYAVLLQECYTAIKAIDSTATVISGGVTTASSSDGGSAGGGNYSGVLLPNSFIYLMYQAMGGSSTGYCDAIGIHPYCSPTPASIGGGSNWGYYFNPSGTHPFAMSSVCAWDSIAVIMGHNGESTKTIWATEVGYNTDDVSEANQATYTINMMNLAAAISNVAFFFYFNWNDDGDGAWGLTTSGFAAKPVLADVITFIDSGVGTVTTTGITRSTASAFPLDVSLNPSTHGGNISITIPTLGAAGEVIIVDVAVDGGAGIASIIASNGMTFFPYTGEYQPTPQNTTIVSYSTEVTAATAGDTDVIITVVPTDITIDYMSITVDALDSSLGANTQWYAHNSPSGGVSTVTPSTSIQFPDITSPATPELQAYHGYAQTIGGGASGGVSPINGAAMNYVVTPSGNLVVFGRVAPSTEYAPVGDISSAEPSIATGAVWTATLPSTYVLPPPHMENQAVMRSRSR